MFFSSARPLRMSLTRFVKSSDTRTCLPRSLCACENTRSLSVTVRKRTSTALDLSLCTRTRGIPRVTSMSVLITLRTLASHSSCLYVSVREIPKKMRFCRRMWFSCRSTRFARSFTALFHTSCSVCISWCRAVRACRCSSRRSCVCFNRQSKTQGKYTRLPPEE